ncbi:MAG TPA: hypothetical protein VJJ25_04850 [Nitrosopumilaceae archaeon]|nr:hypothetical protein [Nitrosopumilaceae archaeon]
MGGAWETLFIFASLITILIILSSINYSNDYAKTELLTCDELAFEIAENGDYRGGTEWDVYHKKCFPEELKKASLLEISEYFTNLDCNELAVHIVKRHFENEQAELVYKFKCGDPANINFTSIVIDYDKSPKTEYIPKNPNRGRG